MSKPRTFAHSEISWNVPKHLNHIEPFSDNVVTSIESYIDDGLLHVVEYDTVNHCSHNDYMRIEDANSSLKDATMAYIKNRFKNFALSVVEMVIETSETTIGGGLRILNSESCRIECH